VERPLYFALAVVVVLAVAVVVVLAVAVVVVVAVVVASGYAKASALAISSPPQRCFSPWGMPFLERRRTKFRS
jgi:hypothetical protein